MPKPGKKPIITVGRNPLRKLLGTAPGTYYVRAAPRLDQLDKR